MYLLAFRLVWLIKYIFGLIFQSRLFSSFCCCDNNYFRALPSSSKVCGLEQVLLLGQVFLQYNSFFLQSDTHLTNTNKFFIHSAKLMPTAKFALTKLETRATFSSIPLVYTRPSLGGANARGHASWHAIKRIEYNVLDNAWVPTAKCTPSEFQAHLAFVTLFGSSWPIGRRWWWWR